MATTITRARIFSALRNEFGSVIVKVTIPTASIIQIPSRIRSTTIDEAMAVADAEIRRETT